MGDTFVQNPKDLNSLAIALQPNPQLPPPTNPLEPQMAAPGPIDLPGQQAPNLGLNLPTVKAPVGTLPGNKDEVARLQNTGSGISQIPQKMPNHPVLGHALQTLATVGDTILSNLPGNLGGIGRGIESMIPGTQGHHNMLLGQAQQNVNEGEANAEKEAQTAGAQQQGDLHEQQARAAELTPTTEEESTALGVPVGTMLNAASRAALAKQSGINSTKIQTTGMTVQGRQDVADANNLTREKVSALKPEQRDDRAIRLMEKPPEARTQEENAYLGAYSKWVDQTKIQPGVQRMMALAQFRPVQVLGPDGEVHYDFSGHAIKSGASSPQSMNFRTALGMSRFMTSGQGGQTITAYNTANDHLDLLGKAMDALQNGDVQGLNQLDNAFKQQFGSAAPTNVNAVKAMLAGELANVAKVTGATDQEIKEQKDNINRASSPEQIKGFIDENHDLLDQKAFEMYQQYQTGMQGKPAFGTGRPIKGPNGQQPAATGGAAPTRPTGVPANAVWNEGAKQWQLPPNT
jgi:hypothetical protein